MVRFDPPDSHAYSIPLFSFIKRDPFESTVGSLQLDGHPVAHCGELESNVRLIDMEDEDVVDYTE
jgi:hypothetical protein